MSSEVKPFKSRLVVNYNAYIVESLLSGIVSVDLVLT